eukprot:CAMPEP_0195646894 /NCGR_PEP_ID=MMETSP0815-20121206/29790_1 /TAXON_ID=97485 /ORGANISM="Prymnesium parvum, Strain Texoma1" /LENGTH=36 /DNA_ID= /DNA_START= /DNA_END= /DNA_ORIENTATION=
MAERPMQQLCPHLGSTQPERAIGTRCAAASLEGAAH